MWFLLVSSRSSLALYSSKHAVLSFFLRHIRQFIVQLYFPFIFRLDEHLQSTRNYYEKYIL
jgi:hypothetical protein